MKVYVVGECKMSTNFVCSDGAIP